jgi:hypothetical protein
VRARIAGDLGDTGRVDLRAKVRNLGRLPISSIGWGRLLSASAFALSDVREHTAAPTNLRPKKVLAQLGAVHTRGQAVADPDLAERLLMIAGRDLAGVNQRMEGLAISAGLFCS